MQPTMLFHVYGRDQSLYLVRLYDCSSIAGRNNPPVVVNSQERQKLGCGTLKEGGEVERANRIEVASG